MTLFPRRRGSKGPILRNLDPRLRGDDGDCDIGTIFKGIIPGMGSIRVHFYTIMGISLLLSACAPHALNKNPKPEVTASDSFTIQSDASAKNTDVWFKSFKNPALDTLITQAYTQNFDIKAALARIDAANAVTKQSRADLLPSLNATARTSDGITRGVSDEAVTQVGAQLDWEVDLFGRLRSLNSADAYLAAATREDAEALHLFLSSDIATAYYDAVAAHRTLDLLKDQEGLDQKFLDLLDLRFQQGVGTNVDVLQQKRQLSDTQSLVPPVEADLRVAENRLDVLAGQPPDGADRTLKSAGFPDIEDLPPLGVPSDLLLNRPDLKALKSALIAQDAEIAAAISDRLPRITLSGAYLYADGPGASGPAATILGGLVQPLLDWGQRRAAVAENEALYREQLATFTQTYLEAIEDVENALYQENRQREFLRRLRDRLSILQETVTQSEAVYKQGLSDYLPVLDALQDLREVERTLILEERRLIQFRINLHRALGSNYMPVPLKDNHV